MKILSKVLPLALLCATPMLAHFQTVITDKSVLSQQDSSEINIAYEFTHPFEMELMNMQKPQAAGVFMDGKKVSILDSLKGVTKNGLQTWSAKYSVKEPGVYQFFVDPAPYFEPAEGKFIRHQTKTIVDAYGSGEGWDKPIGLKAEIVPLSRPYSLYVGNIFSAQVLYKGKPVPNAEVEIEFYNTKKLKAPNDMFTTQVVKADQNGVFHASLPFEGWWGFAALIDDDETIKKDGVNYPVELGAVIWLKSESVK